MSFLELKMFGPQWLLLYGHKQLKDSSNLQSFRTLRKSYEIGITWLSLWWLFILGWTIPWNKHSTTQLELFNIDQAPLILVVQDYLWHSKCMQSMSVALFNLQEPIHAMMLLGPFSSSVVFVFCLISVTLVVFCFVKSSVCSFGVCVMPRRNANLPEPPAG